MAIIIKCDFCGDKEELDNSGTTFWENTDTKEDMHFCLDCTCTIDMLLDRQITLKEEID